LNFSFLDDGGSMFFDIGGTVRVRVPTGKARSWIQDRMEAGRTAVFSTNGPISLDVAWTPRERQGEEFLIAVQADVIVRTPVLVAKLIAKGAGRLSAAAFAGAVERATASLAALDIGTVGEVLRVGVEELPPFLGGSGAVITYVAYLVGGETWRERLRATISPAGLLRHFALGAVLIGTSRGLVPVGASLGAALGATFFPGGAPLVVTALATRAVLWFGTHTVEIVALKVPVWWRLARLGRMYRRVLRSQGERKLRRERRFLDYRERVIRRTLAELDEAFTQWRALRTLLNWLRYKVKFAREPAAFDLTPYRPLIDALTRKLAAMAHAGDWYAGRFYYQLKDAIRELDQADPWAPDPRGVWERFS
jgi:hypothetical protein